MNIYCILKENNLKRKIVLSPELQKSLHEYISQSINQIMTASKEPFTGEYRPDDNEVLFIDNFENPYKNFEYLSLKPLQVEEIENIKTIVFDNKEVIAYQCFDSRKIIRPQKWHLIYSNDTYIKIDNKGLVIENKVDALFEKRTMTLLFYSYHNTSKILDLSKYYREATKEEIDSFCKNKIFHTEKSFSTDNFNTKIRKKIYLIKKNDILKRIKNNFEEVADYAVQLNLGDFFKKDKKLINFPNKKKEIEKLINFLNDDLYKSPISNLIYETNSKKIIK